jgi:hypothetical protein
MDCGGKRSATPLLPAGKTGVIPKIFVRSKAPSSLRFAGAVQNLAAKHRFVEKETTCQRSR